MSVKRSASFRVSLTSRRVGLRLISLGVFLLLGAATLPAPTQAQNFGKPDPERGVTRLKDILVTAQKREQLIQDVPLPITAFDADQLETLKVRDLGDLTVGIPMSGSMRLAPHAGRRIFQYAVWASTVRFRRLTRQSGCLLMACIWGPTRWCCTTPSTLKA